MPDTTGKIRAKALDGTGFTEEMLARDWSAGAGRTRLVLAEISSVEPHGPNIDGKKRIDYVISGIEPIPTEHEERFREVQRGLYLARPDREGQATLDGTAGANGDALGSAIGAATAIVERDDDGAPVGVWDGSTDGPLSVVPDPPEGGYCPFPGCDLEDEHDGDHNVPDPDDES